MWCWSRDTKDLWILRFALLPYTRRRLNLYWLLWPDSLFPYLVPSSLLVLFPPFLLLLPNNPLPYVPSSCNYNIHNPSYSPLPFPLPVELFPLNLLISLSFSDPPLIISR